jgi:hypothetical protein
MIGTPELVNVAEVVALLDEDPGTGLAYRNLRVEASQHDPQIARFGRGLLNVRREEPGSDIAEFAAAVRGATGWATLLVDVEPAIRLLFAPQAGRVLTLRLEVGGWMSLRLEENGIALDPALFADANGALFDIVDGPSAGRAIAWHGEEWATREPGGTWNISNDRAADPVSGFEAAVRDFIRELA